MTAIFEKLPEVLQYNVFEFYNPYREYFTKKIIKSTGFWEQIWLRRLWRESDPKIYFVMEYVLGEWGIFDPEDDPYKKTQYIPSNINIYCQQMFDRIHITIYHEEGPNLDFIFMGEVFTQEQYKHFVLEECNPNASNHHVSVHWNDEFHLEQMI
jgi:hypothetical protein